MHHGFTLTCELTDYANRPVDKWTDPNEVDQHKWVLRQYDEPIHAWTREEFARQEIASRGVPVNADEPDWNAWQAYAASLEPSQPETLPILV